MTDCTHEEQTPFPDSLATVCNECGQVFICGKPWDYKSGHITEWLNDVYGDKDAEIQNGTPRDG